MAINQRSLGSDTQKRVLSFSFDPNVGHGHSGPIVMMPYPCRINAIQMTCYAVTDSPFLLLSIHRFIPGTGFTAITFGTTFVVPILGTSGYFATGLTLPTGETLLTLAANDILNYVCDGSSANAAINGLVGAIVVTPVQDNIKYFGNLI